LANSVPDAFNNPPGGRPISQQIQLTPDQVDAVAAFLRLINAVENDRSAVAYATVAMRARALRDALRPLSLAIKDTADAIRVLTEKRLDRDAVESLRRARRLLALALVTPLRGPRNLLIQSAIQSLHDARASIVESG